MGLSLATLVVGATAALVAREGKPARPAPVPAGERAAFPQDARGRERAMYVRVVNSEGAPVTGLSAREFVVREDGVAREVLAAEPADDPITIALLVDNSQAASPVIADVRRALKAFVERMGGKNPMAVTTFAERPTILQDYTLVVPQLVRGIERIFPVSGSGAYLLQALQEVSRGFAKRDFDRGIMVAITAEGPEFSELNHDQVVPLLRESGAALDIFVFHAPAPLDPSEQSARERALVLDQGPDATGGRRVTLLSSMALDAALERLAAQLANEYRITYSRPESLIPPEKIQVTVTRPGLEARGTPIRPRRG
jgi:VWFA-related protein